MRGTLLGVSIIRIIVLWGLYWGLPIQGNYKIGGQSRSWGKCVGYRVRALGRKWSRFISGVPTYHLLRPVSRNQGDPI